MFQFISISSLQPEIKQFFSIPKGAIPHLDWKQRYDNPADENIEDLENEIKDLEEQLIKVKDLSSKIFYVFSPKFIFRSKCSNSCAMRSWNSWSN